MIGTIHNFKITILLRISMIDKNELNQILAFVSKRWTDLSRDPDNKALKSLPSAFWMNSLGGPTNNKGRWVTTIMYTEDEDEAKQIQRCIDEMAIQTTTAKSTRFGSNKRNERKL